VGTAQVDRRLQPSAPKARLELGVVVRHRHLAQRLVSHEVDATPLGQRRHGESCGAGESHLVIERGGEQRACLSKEPLSLLGPTALGDVAEHDIEDEVRSLAVAGDRCLGGKFLPTLAEAGDVAPVSHPASALGTPPKL